ncbi:MAG TPA: SBBP repeat-containing protein [Verrucomicrobiae bacterium]|nr:SBBP repeat-containing protein [Verrucomicrobiae bacterium]
MALILSAFAATAQTISPSNLPLYFEANQNQTEFLSSGNGFQFTISASGVQMSLRESRAHAAIAQMQFAGANAEAQIHGGNEMSSKINYLIGNDPSKWQTGLPTFGNVQVTELYPGINMVFHGNRRQLEYDFDIAPGANSDAIKMQFSGVDKISVTAEGDFVLKIAGHEIRQPKPEIYQTISGARRTVAGGYKILDSRTVAFEVAKYDRTQPLVIDPVLGFSTFFGGNVSDTPRAIAMDPNNCIYIAGQTFSKQFSTSSAIQTNFEGGTYIGDAFVAKFAGSPPTKLIYLTYLGGSADDVAFGVAADASGNVFIAGETDSPNFPTNNAYIQKIPTSQIVGQYAGCGFVAELNTNGTSLEYSTYLGGSYESGAQAIAVDSSDNAYVSGFTYSTNFPVTLSTAMQKHLACTNSQFLNYNGFVTEIANGGGSLVYSTYLGGTNFDDATSIFVDSGNYVYVAGYTASTNFPVWMAPANQIGATILNNKTNANGYTPSDAFVTKFPPLASQPSSISSLVYSMFLGGTNDDAAYGVAADASGNAYVTGWTASTNFPIIAEPPGLTSFLATNGNRGPVATNVFLTKIAPNGSAILNSTVFGGRSIDMGFKVAVDPAGDAFVVGSESSTNFPTTNGFGSLSVTNSGGYDAFVTGISADWSTMFYSICIGGSRDDLGYGIVLDSATNAYITGNTDSTNYPTFNTGRLSFNGTNVINGTNYIDGTRFTGTNDVFLTEIIFAPTPPVVSIEPTNLTVGWGATVTFNATMGQFLYQWQTNGTNLVNGGRIRGANSASLIITNALPSDSDTNYGVIVSNPAGSDTLSNVTLTVLDMPYILVAPTNQMLTPGSNINFTVVASGSPLLYLWSTNNAVSFLTNSKHISGATNNSLTISNAQPDDAGVYTVYVYNGITTYTNVSAILANPLSITDDPTNQTVGAGSTVSFSVAAAGAPLFYQWSNSVTGAFLTNGTGVSGATSSTLILTNVQTSDTGTYTVFVNNGIQFSNVSATLTVILPPSATFTSFAPAAGNGMVFSGTGGATNGTYSVLTSSNLMAPIPQWTPIATNQFDGNGQFIFTNPVSTNGSQFFILKEP